LLFEGEGLVWAWEGEPVEFDGWLAAVLGLAELDDVGGVWADWLLEPDMLEFEGEDCAEGFCAVELVSGPVELGAVDAAGCWAAGCWAVELLGDCAKAAPVSASVSAVVVKNRKVMFLSLQSIGNR
jgi:hypothetical protein